MAKFSDERVRAIIAGPRAFRVYEFPGADGVHVAFRVLTEAEIDDARMGAQRELREYSKLRGWDPTAVFDFDPDLMQRMVERHIVFRATFDADTIEAGDPARFFEKPDQLRDLDSVTMTRLMELYTEHQEWASPLKQLEPGETEALLDQLGKSQTPELYLGAFAPSMLRRFVISLASRVRSAT